MGFLAPWFLLLGGAAIVPLLIHLLRRRIGMQVDFPAARYLARGLARSYSHVQSVGNDKAAQRQAALEKTEQHGYQGRSPRF